jgi:hypothetical protein
MPEERIEISRPVAAPPDRIFALICSPQGHVQIDGSGMLIASDSPSVTAVGDTFEVHMDRRPLGDIPDMAEYDVTVIITGYEQDRRLEWSVMRPSGRPYGHIYGYHLEPSGSHTVVTSFCDWSGLPEHRKDPSRWPVVPANLLEASLLNLERAVTSAD